MNTRYGAGDRTRTGTLSPAVDFESTTSTNSITPAGYSNIIHHTHKNSKQNFSVLSTSKIISSGDVALALGGRV